jgi:hypothetical protein
MQMIALLKPGRCRLGAALALTASGLVGGGEMVSDVVTEFKDGRTHRDTSGWRASFTRVPCARILERPPK